MSQLYSPFISPFSNSLYCPFGGSAGAMSGYPPSLMLYLSGLNSLVGPELTTSLVTGTDLLYDDGTVYIGPSFTGGSEGAGVWPEIDDGVTQVSTAATVGGNGYSVEMSLGMMSFFASQDSGTIEFSILMGVASADITEDQNLFTVTDTVTGGLYRSAGGVLKFAGAEYTVPGGWSAGEELKVQIKKTEGLVSVGVDGDFGTAVTFVPFEIVDYLRFGFLTAAQFGRGDFKLYNQQDSIWTEVLANGDFTDGLSNWRVYLADEFNYVTIVNESAHFVSDGSLQILYQPGIFVLGKRYALTIDIQELSGEIKMYQTGGALWTKRISAPGRYTFYLTGDGDSYFYIARNNSGYPVDALIASISIKEESTTYA